MESGNLRLPKQLTIIRLHVQPQQQHLTTEAWEKHHGMYLIKYMLF